MRTLLKSQEHLSSLMNRGAALSKRAFSLVEVTLAIGVVAFGLTAILGLLPIGLGMVKDARDSTMQTLIFRHMLGELTSLSFEDLNAQNNRSFYFSEEAIPQEVRDGAFYEVQLEVLDPSFPGMTSESRTSFRLIRGRLSFPLERPEVAREHAAFSTLVARQNNEPSPGP